MIDCRCCGKKIGREDTECSHCGASTPFACSTFPYTPRVTELEHPDLAKRRRFSLIGFGAGCVMGVISFAIGRGLAAIPYVGWILAIGFICAAFFWPFLGAWLGSLAGED